MTLRNRAKIFLTSLALLSVVNCKQRGFNANVKSNGDSAQNSSLNDYGGTSFCSTARIGNLDNVDYSDIASALGAGADCEAANDQASPGLQLGGGEEGLQKLVLTFFENRAVVSITDESGKVQKLGWVSKQEGQELNSIRDSAAKKQNKGAFSALTRLWKEDEALTAEGQEKCAKILSQYSALNLSATTPNIEKNIDPLLEKLIAMAKRLKAVEGTNKAYLSEVLSPVIEDMTKMRYNSGYFSDTEKVKYKTEAARQGILEIGRIFDKKQAKLNKRYAIQLEEMLPDLLPHYMKRN